jgi:hypothetical protein
MYADDNDAITENFFMNKLYLAEEGMMIDIIFIIWNREPPCYNVISQSIVLNDYGLLALIFSMLNAVIGEIDVL